MSAADFLGDQMDDDEVREAWRTGQLVPSWCLNAEVPSRDARVLAWLVAFIGAPALLDSIDHQSGGSLGERTKRAEARRRIEELA